MEVLKAVQEHGAVHLFKYVLSDRDTQVGANTEDVAVECSMVQLAQSHTVWNHRLTSISVANDVGRFDQF